MIAIMTDDPLAALFADAPRRVLRRGALIFRRDDPVRQALWLERGRAALTRPASTGAGLTLGQAEGPCWLAEASAFAERYHCDAEALTEVALRALPKARLIEAVTTSAPGLALTLIERLSRELRDARARAERLALKTVAERLDAWEAALGPKPATLSWARVADEIGVTPEALYRELSRRRRLRS